jgi:hypothetical protein
MARAAAGVKHGLAKPIQALRTIASTRIYLRVDRGFCCLLRGRPNIVPLFRLLRRIPILGDGTAAHKKRD